MPDPFTRGQTSASPLIVIGGGRRLADFLKAVFGAEMLWRMDGLGSSPERSQGGTVLSFDRQEGAGDADGFIAIAVPNARDAFESALERGASPVMAPARLPSGVVVASVRDRLGNVWRLEERAGGAGEDVPPMRRSDPGRRKTYVQNTLIGALGC